MSTQPTNQTDDDILCEAIASGPKDVNVIYVLPRNEDIADDIREGTLCEEEFGLREALATEDRITAAVLRCLAAGRLRAHHESDPDDPSLCCVAITAQGMNLKIGDCFAFDGSAYFDGDILYVEVLDAVPRLPDHVDRVGMAEGGYKVAVYCSQEPTHVEDFYAWDFFGWKCAALTADKMALARCAGWPRTYTHFREVLGDEIALLTSRGAPVPPLG